ncbi:MAG: glutathione S-transferase N-terminal domain-containing protein [Gammaproteobacteria bacterium]|jgi:glutaredoxin 3|nr:glutathione S-transferase N-terminal domain-containing protein [Gammaproteobacteria bacterium]
MARVIIYSTASCPICERCKSLLQRLGIPYEELRLDEDADGSRKRSFARATDGARTVPQILIDGRWIGGYSELTEMHMDGELEPLIQAG